MIKSKTIYFILLAVVLVGSLMLNGCTLASSGEPPQGFDWTAIIMLLVLFAMVYFLIIRPMKKRQKAQQKLMTELKIGDQVITAGGIYGEIESMDNESIVIKVESGTKIRVLKQGIMVRP